MTHNSEILNPKPTKLPDLVTDQVPHFDHKELTQKEIIQRIKEKSQIEGNNEGFKSLHR